MNVLNGPGGSAAGLIVEAAINSIWQGALLAALIWLLLRLFVRSNATTRYGVWFVAMIAVICLPFLNALVSDRSRTAQRLSSSTYRRGQEFSYATQTPLQEHEKPTKTRSLSLERGGALKETEPIASSRMEAEEPVAAQKIAPVVPLEALTTQATPAIKLSGERWPRLFLSLWLLGALAMLFRLLLSYLSLRKLKGTARPLAQIYQRRLACWLKSCGINRKIRLHGSKEAAVPLMLGLRETIILFPWELTNALAEDEFDQVLLHELAHARRRDDWTNLLQKLCEALLFFHPAVWLIGRELNAERELACDQWVIAWTGAHRSYASCLTRLFELTNRTGPQLLAPGALKAGSNLTRRIETILKSKRNTPARLSPLRLTVPLLLLCLLLIQFGRIPPVIALSATYDSAAGATAQSESSLQQSDASGGPINVWLESDADAPEKSSGAAPTPAHRSDVAAARRPQQPSAEQAQGFSFIPVELARNDARAEMLSLNESLGNGPENPPDGPPQPHAEAVRAARTMAAPQSQGSAGDDKLGQAASEFLRMVEAADSAASQRELLLAFLKRGDLSREFLVQAFVVAKRMDSDGEKAEFLIKAAEYCTSDTAVQNAFFNAVASIDSAGEKRRALEGVLKTRGHERAVLLRALKVAATVNSDGETAELLVRAAGANAIDGEALTVFLNTVSSIDSAAERRRALTAVLRRGVVSKETLAQVVRYARNISSDGEKAEFLIRFAAACQDSDAALSAYMATAASIHSEAEQKRALNAILKRSTS